MRSYRLFIIFAIVIVGIVIMHGGYAKPTPEPKTPKPTPEPKKPTSTPTPDVSVPVEPTPEPKTPTSTPTQPVDNSTPTPTRPIDNSTPTPTQPVDNSTPTPTQPVDNSTPTPTPTTNTQSSSSSRGGSSGAEAISIEPYNNIASYEIREGNLVYNQSVEYSFSSPEFSVYQILINGRQNEYDISVRVESLKNSSRLAKPAPGIVYKNENIWIGSKKLNYIIVRFKVKNSWMEDNSLNDTRYPYLLKWNGTTWLVYKTNITGKDRLYTYFESSKTIGAVFAISAPRPKINQTKVQDTTSVEEVVQIVPEKEEIEETVVPEQTEKLLGFDMIMTMISIILLYLLTKKGNIIK